jgi:hypothetical protein
LNLKMGSPDGYGVARVLAMFLEPTVQQVGVHAVLGSDGANGCARELASGYQVGFELCAVARGVRGAVGGFGVSLSMIVSMLLRGQDIAGVAIESQDGFAGRLRKSCGPGPTAGLKSCSRTAGSRARKLRAEVY